MGTEFWPELGLFVLKAVIIVACLLAIIGGIARAAARGGGDKRGTLKVRKINDDYRKLALRLQGAVLPRRAHKLALKAEKARQKRVKKAPAPAADAPPARPRVFVLGFDGNMRASQVASLRQEVTAVLAIARPSDEVVVRLTSPGGLVHAYGLGASQLERIRARAVPLTVAIDTVAASGGYLMACVADTVVAAPFAVVGSIGVVAGIPNFHRFLKERDIDFELLTAGEYKRTLTLFGENTDEGRAKFQSELDSTHQLFKGFVSRYRPQLDMEKVATGEHWYGQRALELGLVDRLTTSDDYLVDRLDGADLFEVRHVVKRGVLDRFSRAISAGVVRGIERLWQRSADRPMV